jgi:hypothetical protein
MPPARQLFSRHTIRGIWQDGPFEVLLKKRISFSDLRLKACHKKQEKICVENQSYRYIQVTYPGHLQLFGVS